MTRSAAVASEAFDNLGTRPWFDNNKSMPVAAPVKGMRQEEGSHLTLSDDDQLATVQLRCMCCDVLIPWECRQEMCIPQLQLFFVQLCMGDDENARMWIEVNPMCASFLYFEFV
jgi:hypothetical protein